MVDNSNLSCGLGPAFACGRSLSYTFNPHIPGARKIPVEEGGCYLMPIEHSSIDAGDIEDLLRAPIDDKTRKILQSEVGPDALYPKGRRPCVVANVDRKRGVVIAYPLATYGQKTDFAKLRPDAREFSVPVYPFFPENYNGIHVHSSPELHCGNPSSNESIVQYVRAKAVKMEGILVLEPYLVEGDIDGDGNKIKHQIRFEESELDKLKAHSRTAMAHCEELFSDGAQSSRLARSLIESRRRTRDRQSIATQGNERYGPGNLGSARGSFGVFSNLARRSNVVGHVYGSSDRHSIAQAIPEGDDDEDWRTSPNKRLKISADNGASKRGGGDRASWRRPTASVPKGDENEWTTVSRAKKPKITSGRVSLLSNVRLGSRF